MHSPILHRLLAHNAWTTRELLVHCRRCSSSQFSQQVAIGPGSLHDTFTHIVGCMERWSDRIAGRQLRPSLEDQGKTFTPDELIERLDRASAELTEVAGAVESDGRLEEPMEVTFQDTAYRFSRGTAIVHVLTHGMHHRAQVFNMLRQLDMVPDIDGDTIEWEIAVNEAAPNR